MDKTVKQIKPMECPVCGKFYFSKLLDEEISAGVSPNSVQCPRCGWFYDLEQTENHELKFQANSMSLNEFRKDYCDKLKINPNYDYSDENKAAGKPHRCPVCGKYVFKDELSYDVCPVCGWQDDGCENGEGANSLTLSQAKENYLSKK